MSTKFKPEPLGSPYTVNFPLALVKSTSDILIGTPAFELTGDFGQSRPLNPDKSMHAVVLQLFSDVNTGLIAIVAEVDDGRGNNNSPEALADVGLDALGNPLTHGTNPAAGKRNGRKHAANSASSGKSGGVANIDSDAAYPKIKGSLAYDSPSAGRAGLRSSAYRMLFVVFRTNCGAKASRNNAIVMVKRSPEVFFNTATEFIIKHLIFSLIERLIKEGSVDDNFHAQPGVTATIGNATSAEEAENWMELHRARGAASVGRYKVDLAAGLRLDAAAGNKNAKPTPKRGDGLSSNKSLAITATDDAGGTGAAASDDSNGSETNSSPADHAENID